MVSTALPDVGDLESPICDLVRKTLAASIVCAALDREFRSWERLFPKEYRVLNNRLNEELDLLFAYVDDMKFEAKAIREKFYEVLNSKIEADNQWTVRAV